MKDYNEIKEFVEQNRALDRKEFTIAVCSRWTDERRNLAFKILDNPEDADKLIQSQEIIMSKTHYAFPSIEQFAHVKRNIQHKAQFVGLDDAGEPIMNRAATLPKIQFEGKVKLHGCLHADTLITMADGSTEKISKLNIGDNVLSYDVVKKEFQDSVVNRVWSDELDKKWMKLHFDDRFIVCTEDHKFFTSGGWKEAQDLTPDDEFIFDESEFVP